MTDQQEPEIDDDMETELGPDPEAERELIYAARLEEEVQAARSEIKPEWVKWADLYVGSCRSNASEACRVMGVPERTGRSWLVHKRVRRYMVALVARDAAKLMVSKSTIIQELAFIAMSDPTELFEMLSQATGSSLSGHLGVGRPRVPEIDSATPRAVHEARDIPLAPRLRDITKLPRRVSRAIKAIDVDSEGRPTRITFHDKARALELLGRAYRMFEGAGLIDEKQEPWSGFNILPPKSVEE